jgi:hypothetical protein
MRSVTRKRNPRPNISYQYTCTQLYWYQFTYKALRMKKTKHKGRRGSCNIRESHLLQSSGESVLSISYQYTYAQLYQFTYKALRKKKPKHKGQSHLLQSSGERVLGILNDKTVFLSFKRIPPVVVIVHLNEFACSRVKVKQKCERALASCQCGPLRCVSNPQSHPQP